MLTLNSPLLMESLPSTVGSGSYLLSIHSLPLLIFPTPSAYRSRVLFGVLPISPFLLLGITDTITYRQIIGQVSRAHFQSVKAM